MGNTPCGVWEMAGPGCEVTLLCATPFIDRAILPTFNYSEVSYLIQRLPKVIRGNRLLLSVTCHLHLLERALLGAQWWCLERYEGRHR